MAAAVPQKMIKWIIHQSFTLQNYLKVATKAELIEEITLIPFKDQGWITLSTAMFARILFLNHLVKIEVNQMNLRTRVIVVVNRKDSNLLRVINLM